jgi:large subunit ribosomal protein L21
MKIAVIETGGKQYLVSENETVKIEKLNGKAGDKIAFANVLLLIEDEGKKIELGKPFIQNAAVEGEIIEQAKDKKVTVIKFKRKGHYRRKVGHRQMFTKVKVKKIKG